MDNEFEPVHKLVVNTTAMGENIGEIERKIRHIKNLSRSTKATLPYKKLPKFIIKALLHNVILWMNTLVSKLGISD